MRQLVVAWLLVLAGSGLIAHTDDQDYTDSDVTFLSSADFELASMMSFDDIDRTAPPFDDPEANQPYYEGDMMIREAEEQRVAMYMPKRWPNGRIPYQMENKFTAEERAAIARGIMTLQDRTCITFVPRKDEEPDYVWIRNGPGCAAHVGRIGGQQWMFLGRGCFSLETVVHEFMHAVGFIHEQSRPDRDAHVKIMWDNIKDGAKRNFRKHTTDYLADHGFKYDLMSVMHYREFAFSKNRKPTIVARRPVPHLRCRGSDCPSDLDVRKMNYLYDCSDGKSGFDGGKDKPWVKPSRNKRKKKKKKKKKTEWGGDPFDNHVLIGGHYFSPVGVAYPAIHYGFELSPTDQEERDTEDEDQRQRDPDYEPHLYERYVPYESRVVRSATTPPKNRTDSSDHSLLSWVSQLFH